MFNVTVQQIEAAKKLPSCKDVLSNGKGDHCAWGKVIAAIIGEPIELRFHDEFKSMFQYVNPQVPVVLGKILTAVGRELFWNIAHLNDGDQPEIATNQAFNTAIQAGLIQVVEKAETKRELALV